MFSRQYAIGWARLFLASNRHLKLIHATLVPDGPPANLSRVGCDHCDPYRWWRSQWDVVSAVIYPVAELMSIEGNAILRFRDKYGAVSVLVLQGRDPRPIRAGNFAGRVIHIDQHGYVLTPLIKLYVTGTGTMSSDDAAATAKDLATRLGVREVAIEYRADPWFIEEIWTPFFPLFDAPGPVPAEQEFKATKTLQFSYLLPSHPRGSWKGLVTLP